MEQVEDTLAGDADSADAEAMAPVGIELDEVRRRIEESFGPGALGRGPAPQGTGSRAGRVTMTGEAKQSLELAIKEARALRHTYLGDEHLLLGLLGVAQLSPRGDFIPETLGTLRDLGIDPAVARQRVLDELRHASDLT